MTTSKTELIIDEEQIQQKWISNNIIGHFIGPNTFDLNAKTSEVFTSHDGPPFATGKPHHGHILAGFGKDTIRKYQRQTGKTLVDKVGWDCHGLPIEYEIEKKFSIKTKQQIEEWGIGNYNTACRDIVMSCVDDWDLIMNRLGRWIDFKNDYKTMDYDFMNSVWWVFGQLSKKGLVYSSYRVMPYSVACKTPLSNFETQQNYQDVEDQTVYIEFELVNNLALDELIKMTKIDSSDKIRLLVWTTTPWTLPSNLVIAVGPCLKYALVCSDSKYYIVSLNLVESIFTKLAKKEFTIISIWDGKDLVGLNYKPIFNSYPIHLLKDSSKAFEIIQAEFVSDMSGTGLVHIAPSYGEDDYLACISNGIIDKMDKLFMSIDDEGYFIHGLNGLEDLGGVFYKNYLKSPTLDANTMIIIKLKTLNIMFGQTRYKHTYPFCWRSDTPLMYKAIKSWFINVEAIKDRMVELNKQINWYPSHVGTGRFSQWLTQAKDWCVARTRYWGTPIPIWSNIDDPSDYIVIDSAAQLEKLCGLDPNTIIDIHRDKIDHYTFVKNGFTYKRIDDVFDCWFESGSMPYASIGYPWKQHNMDQLPYNFTADFITEGIDQTRGWFYTLLVISTALFDTIPFKNVIVNGLILASDGKKMSKRLKNYPDPSDIIEKYGSDALRLYLLGSPATKGESLKFNEVGVRDIVKDIIIPLKSSLSFYLEYEHKFKLDNPDVSLYVFDNDIDKYCSNNPLDAYAIKYIGDLISSINNDLSKYQLSDAVKKINNLVEMLNNQYIKYNRFSLKGKNIDDDPDSWRSSLSVLGFLLRFMTINLAPLMPFFAEYLYEQLNMSTKYIRDGLVVNGLVVDGLVHNIPSVHLVNFDSIRIPTLNSKAILMADEMIHVIRVIKQVCLIRSKNGISMKSPLEKVFIRSSEDVLIILNKYSNFILDELIVLELEVEAFKLSDIQIELKPKFQIIKEVYPSNIELIVKLINNTNIPNDTNNALRHMVVQNLPITLGDFTIEPSMLNIIIKPNHIENYIDEYQFIDGSNYIVYLNSVISPRIEQLTYGRIVATRFQRLRKYAGVHPWDKISLGYYGLTKFPIDTEPIATTIVNICNIVPIRLTDQIILDIKPIYKSKLYPIDSSNADSEFNMDLYIY
jgi:isoleucyl-tRNA synthetase